MGYVSVRWETPRFVEYANAQEYLQEMTPQALDWADQLVIPTLKGASGSTWNKAEAWQQLRAHQEAFRGLLDKLIAGGPTQEQMRVLTEHLSHVQPTRRWDGSTDRHRQQAAQGYSDPESWQNIRQALIAKGRQDIGERLLNGNPRRATSSPSTRKTRSTCCIGSLTNSWPKKATAACASVPNANDTLCRPLSTSRSTARRPASRRPIGRSGSGMLRISVPFAQHDAKGRSRWI